jgi:hypothetical protein
VFSRDTPAAAVITHRTSATIATLFPPYFLPVPVPRASG